MTMSVIFSAGSRWNGSTSSFKPYSTGVPHILIGKFIQSGIDVNLKGTVTSRTALHHADVLNEPALVSALLKMGANPDRSDARGVTPRILARHCEDAATGLLIDGIPIKKPALMIKLKTMFS